jgi:hypothetical protein
MGLGLEDALGEVLVGADSASEGLDVDPDEASGCCAAGPGGDHGEDGGLHEGVVEDAWPCGFWHGKYSVAKSWVLCEF